MRGGIISMLKAAFYACMLLLPGMEASSAPDNTTKGDTAYESSNITGTESQGGDSKFSHEEGIATSSSGVPPSREGQSGSVSKKQKHGSKKRKCILS